MAHTDSVLVADVAGLWPVRLATSKQDSGVNIEVQDSLQSQRFLLKS